MKALELLYQYQQANEIAGGYMSKPLDEAIKELEHLKSRTCVTCKHGSIYQFNVYVECENFGTDTGGLEFEKDFYCKNWESR